MRPRRPVLRIGEGAARAAPPPRMPAFAGATTSSVAAAQCQAGEAWRSRDRTAERSKFPLGLTLLRRWLRPLDCFALLAMMMWTASPERHQVPRRDRCRSRIGKPSMKTFIRIGIDLAKNFFQVYAIERESGPAVARKLSRGIRASGPAPTGRTYDRSRPKRSERQKLLAKRPSTYDETAGAPLGVGGGTGIPRKSLQTLKTGAEPASESDRTPRPAVLGASLRGRGGGRSDAREIPAKSLKSLKTGAGPAAPHGPSWGRSTPAPGASRKPGSIDSRGPTAGRGRRASASARWASIC